MPRPSHPGADPAAAQVFKEELGARLEALGLPTGTRVRFWVVDVVIADQAGFQLRAGDSRLPEGVRILPLPHYSAELNPCEQLWDVIRDTEGLANGLFKSINKMRQALLPGLRRFWQDSAAVISLVGRPWLHDQANTTLKI